LPAELLSFLESSTQGRDMDGFGLFILGTAITIGVTVTLGVRLLQLLRGEMRGHRLARRGGSRAALGWTLGFALAAFAAAGFMSIGWFVLPFAILACAVAAWRCRALPEGAIGASLGTGAVLFVLALMNPNRPGPCAHSITLRAGERASFSCGGVNGTSWLPLALVLVLAALATQVMMDRRTKRTAHTGPR
jgi:hypothetical protein